MMNRLRTVDLWIIRGKFFSQEIATKGIDQKEMCKLNPFQPIMEVFLWQK
jgi:hypothetical protein